MARLVFGLTITLLLMMLLLTGISMLNTSLLRVTLVWDISLVRSEVGEQRPGYEVEQDPGQAEQALPGWYIFRPTKLPPGP